MHIWGFDFGFFSLLDHLITCFWFIKAADKCPYFPGQEPTLAGHIDFLLQCIEEEGVEGDLIQPINHKFNHYLLTRLYVYQIKLYPTKFVGCCLANPVEDKTGIKQLEQLVLEITNEARELGVYVGFMLKGLSLHISEIEELCTKFSSTTVLIDHIGFCKPPTLCRNDEEKVTFSNLLNHSKFPRVHVKLSALFRVSRIQYPYDDSSHLLSKVVSNCQPYYVGKQRFSFRGFKVWI
ncbi:hypothetical protein LINPERHAP1_LOCUS10758 [Linum perenne]